MSSVVYYRFLHQKNKNVIHFDGTSINVFDLKREIIQQNQLGSGLDFNLKLFHSDQQDKEYELDQDIIPRSSYVLVKRLPVNHKSGKFNNAARYVTGKPRINKRAIATSNTTTNIPNQQVLDDSATEEDKIKMMFENQSNAWAQTQDELSHHKIVYKPQNTTAPTDAPPPGYICYRCGKKDHWIKNCPTNNDPNFEGKKVLRTTGIPKSYLKTISKEELEKKANELSTNDSGDVVDNDGNAILITDEGDYAIAVADTKTWQNYQERIKNAQMKSQNEYQNKLLAKIKQDNKLEYIDPLNENKVLNPPIYKTACCQNITDLKKLKNINYNKSDLESQLIENDFHCPNCGKEDNYIDSLIENKELSEELTKYIETKETELGIKDPSKRPIDEELPDAKRQKLPQFDPAMFPMGIPPPPGMFIGMPQFPFK
ncbi:unnamed protein product [Candida verbasci]|uniref:Uncharacterized protein n=1 Tax=Candida verbasci TaxID=1227364 RepID=A0A9W4TYH2_9ASCO|nr:unnamed protein product [Candida verbasci]